jgi:hypothetical protein
MTKETIRQLVNTRPDKVTIDDIAECLMLLERFEEGPRQYEASNYFTQEKVKNHLAEWLE